MGVSGGGDCASTVSEREGESGSGAGDSVQVQ